MPEKQLNFTENNEFTAKSISPYQEMLAYETLWAIPGMTEAKLSAFFKQKDELPSKILESLDLQPQSRFIEEPTKLVDLKDTISKYLDKKLGSFSIVVNRDYQYPVGLRHTKHPIELFYYKGNLDLLTSKSVSVVGARKATDAGLARARKVSQELVSEGWTIVSGLASGIDTAALSSAIKSSGHVIAVIGTPIDEYYPKENKELQDRIAEEHLLISQVPFYRYKTEAFRVRKHHFPRRNITMAAISQATVIVEASDTSGSLTQARACISQGKKLFILDSCFSRTDVTWPSHFEKQGAIRVSKTEDILDNLK